MNTTNKTHGSNGIELLDTDLEAVTGGGGFTAAVAAAQASSAPPAQGSWGSVVKRPSKWKEKVGAGMVPVTMGPGTAVEGTAANPTTQAVASAASALKNALS